MNVIDSDKIKEWNYELNNKEDKNPEKLVTGSHEKAWWICPNGHNYYQEIRSHCIVGLGCPYCSGKEVLQGYNDLATTNPELVKLWNFKKNDSTGLTPYNVSKGSNKKVSWLCPKGHEYERTIDHQASRNTPCPICANKKVLVGYNDIRTINPILGKEWDYERNEGIDINSVVPGSPKRVWWKCSICGYEWEAPVKDRAISGRGCRVCGNRSAAEKRINKWLKERPTIDEPLLLKEWDYKKNNDLDPTKCLKGSNKKVWWKCSKCGYEWKSKICNRTGVHRGCPACVGAAVYKGHNDLATKRPDLAKEWHPTLNGNLTPSDVTPGKNLKVWWLCPYGHSYKASLLHRNQGTGCPICNSGRQSSFSEQCFFYYVKELFPDAINRFQDIFKNNMEIDIYIPSFKIGIEYDGVFWHSSNKARSNEVRKYDICKENDVYLIRVKEKYIENNNKIADKIFEIGEDLSKNELSNKIKLVIDYLVNKTGKNFNDLDVNISRDEIRIRKFMQNLNKDSFADLYPNIAVEWDYDKNGELLPTMFRPHSEFSAYWKCSKCGYKWKTTISHRVEGTGCPNCYKERVKIHHFNAKYILQYSLDGKFIKEWDNVSKAGRELGINSSNISECARGKRHMAGGYIWKYK